MHDSVLSIIVRNYYVKKYISRHSIYPSHRSGENVHTRIKSLSRTSIEMYYFYTTCTKLDLAHAFLYERVSVQVRKSDFILVWTFGPERSEGEKATR